MAGIEAQRSPIAIATEVRRNDATGKVALYDRAADPGETEDVADRFPEEFIQVDHFYDMTDRSDHDHPLGAPEIWGGIAVYGRTEAGIAIHFRR